MSTTEKMLPVRRLLSKEHLEMWAVASLTVSAGDCRVVSRFLSLIWVLCRLQSSGLSLLSAVFYLC